MVLQKILLSKTNLGNGIWMWAPIENLQKPYGGWDVPEVVLEDKKDAMEFVTIAALLDITSWLRATIRKNLHLK